MATYLDIESWNRKAQFHLFREYDHPFFNLCVDVEVTPLVSFTKQHELSYFIASLYLATKCANEIEAFRYRLRGEQVLIHARVHPGSTVLNIDETFSFCYFEFDPDFKAFNKESAAQLSRFKSGEKNLNPREDRDDLIHFSVIPWLSFRSFAHARKYGINDSVPKIVFGKYFEDGRKIKMPVSVEVHHALMDGVHVGKFIERFQQLSNDPERNLILG